MHTDAMLRNLSKGLRKELEKTSALIPVLLEIVALYATTWLRPCRAQPVARGETHVAGIKALRKRLLSYPGAMGRTP